MSKDKKKKSKTVKDPGLNVTYVKPRSENQLLYLQSFKEYPVTFGIGCAGTGKTFLATFAAAQWLAENKVQRIVLVRPAIEAGESIGYLPGDMDEKLEPYMQPLLDALNDMIGPQKTREYIRDKIISIIPLGYMRGRTLNNSFVILDEAQNTTITQMKMFLTRMGNYSRFIINGDITQTDLDRRQTSGLLDAYDRLYDCNGVNFIEFDTKDIVRHPIVQDIVNAYELD